MDDEVTITGFLDQEAKLEQSIEKAQQTGNFIVIEENENQQELVDARPTKIRKVAVKRQLEEFQKDTTEVVNISQKFTSTALKMYETLQSKVDTLEKKVTKQEAIERQNSAFESALNANVSLLRELELTIRAKNEEIKTKDEQHEQLLARTLQTLEQQIAKKEEKPFIIQVPDDNDSKYRLISSKSETIQVENSELHKRVQKLQADFEAKSVLAIKHYTDFQLALAKISRIEDENLKCKKDLDNVTNLLRIQKLETDARSSRISSLETELSDYPRKYAIVKRISKHRGSFTMNMWIESPKNVRITSWRGVTYLPNQPWREKIPKKSSTYLTANCLSCVVITMKWLII